MTTIPCSFVWRCVLIACAIVPAAPAQDPVRPMSPATPVAAGDAAAAASGAITIDEMLGETAARLAQIDRASAAVLDARLRETTREIEMRQALLAQIKSGLLVDLPAMGGSRGPAPRRDELEAMRRETESLRRRVAEAEARQSAPVVVKAAPVPQPSVATSLGAALLDVPVEVPKPPAPTLVVAADRPVVDAEGLSRALFAARDFAGSRAAIERIPAAGRTNEIWYRLARCLEEQGRVADAMKIYTQVRDADPKGHWGLQAGSVLNLAAKRQAARQILKPVGGGA